MFKIQRKFRCTMCGYRFKKVILTESFNVKCPKCKSQEVIEYNFYKKNWIFK